MAVGAIATKDASLRIDIDRWWLAAEFSLWLADLCQLYGIARSGGGSAEP